MDSDTNNIGKDNDQRKKEEQRAALLSRRSLILAYLFFFLLGFFYSWMPREWIPRIALISVILITLSFPIIDYYCGRTFPKYLTLLFLITAAVMALCLT